MTMGELKTAFFTGTQVKYKETEHKDIAALIYRRKAGKVMIQVELVDRSKREIVIVSPDQLSTTKEARKI